MMSTPPHSRREAVARVGASGDRDEGLAEPLRVRVALDLHQPPLQLMSTWSWWRLRLDLSRRSGHGGRRQQGSGQSETEPHPVRHRLKGRAGMVTYLLLDGSIIGRAGHEDMGGWAHATSAPPIDYARGYSCGKLLTKGTGIWCWKC